MVDDLNVKSDDVWPAAALLLLSKDERAKHLKVDRSTHFYFVPCVSQQQPFEWNGME